MQWTFPSNAVPAESRRFIFNDGDGVVFLLYLLILGSDRSVMQPDERDAGETQLPKNSKIIGLHLLYSFSCQRGRGSAERRRAPLQPWLLSIST